MNRHTHLNRAVGAILTVAHVVLYGDVNEVARRRTDGPIHDERGMTSTEMAVLAVGIVILAGLVIAGIRAFVMSKIGSMG